MGSKSNCADCRVCKINILRTLTKQELSDISLEKEVRNFKKGDSIFREGEKLNGVYCIKSGVAKMSKMSSNGNEQILNLTSKGCVLGQRSLVTNESANLSAVAVSPVELCFVPKAEIDKALKNNINFTQAILNAISLDLKFTQDRVVNMAQKTVKQRIAKTLLYLHENFELDSDQFISLILTRSDIANIVGAAKEACIRTLAEFKKKSLIYTSGKKIKINNYDLIKNIADGF